jgi:hypothetical protein
MHTVHYTVQIFQSTNSKIRTLIWENVTPSKIDPRLMFYFWMWSGGGLENNLILEGRSEQ